MIQEGKCPWWWRNRFPDFGYNINQIIPKNKKYQKVTLT